MKKPIIILQILFLMFIRCSKDDYEKNYLHYERLADFPEKETWDFKRLSDIKFYFPPRIKVIQNDYLFVLTAEDDIVVKVYEIDSGILITSFGKRGQGPGEFIGAAAILDNNYVPGKFWIYDYTLLKLERYDLVNVLEKKNYMPDSTIKLSVDAGRASDLLFLFQSELVGIGSLISRLCYFNCKGDTVRTNGYIPGKPKKNVPARVHMQAYVGDITKNAQLKKLAVSNLNCDMIEIYDYSGKILKTIHGPDHFVNDYGNVDKYSLASHVEQVGYFTLCSSLHEIYCSYSGQKPKSEGDWITNLGREIFVLDWDGKPLKRVKVNYPLAFMDYSEERNTIYAICYDGEEFFIGYHKL